MADRILNEPHCLVACRWCGELHDHMAVGENEHKCKTGKYAVDEQGKRIQPQKLRKKLEVPKT